MTRGDSTASLLALRAGAGARASASACTGTVASATIATISARTAVVAVVGSFLDPLGIQRHIRRHRRAKVIRLGAGSIGEPTAEGVALALRLSRRLRRRLAFLHALRIGHRRILTVGVERHGIAFDPLAIALNGKQLARVIDIVERAIGPDRNRSHAILLILGVRSVEQLRLVIANTVAVDAARVVVGRKVDVRLAILDRNDRLRLYITAARSPLANIAAVRLANGIVHGKRLGINHCKLTVVIRVLVLITAHKGFGRCASNHNLAVGQHRRRGRAAAKRHLAKFGKCSVRSNRKLMQNTIGAHDISDRSIDQHRRAHALGNLERCNGLSSFGVDRTHRTGIICDDTIVARERQAGPVVALAVLVLMLPHNLAIGDAHAEQVAVARVGPAGRCRPKVGKAVTNRNGRKRLLSTIGASRQLIGYPNRRQSINRQRLQATARKRHEYHAAGVYHTRGRIDLCRQRRFGNGLTRVDIFLEQLGTNGHVEVVTDQQRVGNTLAPFVLALELAHPFCLSVLRGHRSVSYLIGAREAGPVAIPVRTCGTRVNNNTVDAGHSIAGSISPDDFVARLEHVIVIELRPRNAVDKERPSAGQLGAIKRGDKTLDAPIAKLVVHF